MSTYPVHLAAARPARYTRLQLAIRLAASLALGHLHGGSEDPPLQLGDWTTVCRGGL